MKKILIQNNPEITRPSKQEIINSKAVLSGKDCIKVKMSSSLHDKSLAGQLHLMSYGYIFLTAGSKRNPGEGASVWARALGGSTFGIVGMLVADSIGEKSNKKGSIDELMNNPYSEFVSYLDINVIQYSTFGSTAIVSHLAENGMGTINTTFHDVVSTSMAELMLLSRFNFERDIYTNNYNNSGGKLTFGVDLESYLQAKLKHLLSIELLRDFLQRI